MPYGCCPSKEMTVDFGLYYDIYNGMLPRVFCVECLNLNTNSSLILSCVSFLALPSLGCLLS